MGYGRAHMARPWPWLWFVALWPALSAARGLCPPRCSCDDASKSAACVEADLEVVPIQLNPEAQHINLTHNRIYNVHFTFGFYGNLVTLDISHNRIETVGSHNFESNFNLVFLNLSNNQVESVSKNAFTGLKSLETLDLDGNTVSNIEAHAFKDQARLEHLSLANNRLVSLEPDLFKPLVNLRTLSLQNNKILQIPTDNLVYTINLEYLSLSSNIIEDVQESAAPTLRRLRRLELADNIITDIHHAALDGLISLQYLNLNQNNLSSIPTTALSKLANLTHLSLSENFFDSVPPVSFQSLFHLRHLHLSRLEKVTKIDARAFVDNINLERIWMNDNMRVTSIPMRTFHGNPRLTHISIKNNALFTLYANHFPLEQLQSLQLGGNPLHCNCTLLWLWQLGQESAKHIFVNNGSEATSLYVDFADINCATPKHLENARLVNVPESEIKCSLEWVTILMVTLFLSILISVTCSILYYVGALKKCSKDKSKHVMTDSDLTSNLPKMSNGLMYSANHQRPTDDKLEINRYLMMTPQLQETYHSTPPWHTMHKTPISSDPMENMYQQFGYESIPHHKTMDRPHIVYV